MNNYILSFANPHCRRNTILAPKSTGPTPLLWILEIARTKTPGCCLGVLLQIGGCCGYHSSSQSVLVQSDWGSLHAPNCTQVYRTQGLCVCVCVCVFVCVCAGLRATHALQKVVLTTLGLNSQQKKAGHTRI
jgi:uncharacterized membrane protein (UPF0136 family)